MSDYIDTFEGWRERTIDEPYPSHTPRLVEYDENNRTTRVWVREPPVPPLPTAPYTVIRLRRSAGTTAVMVITALGPLDVDNRVLYDRERIKYDSFEVLSEPRAVTAKAVIDRVSEMWTGDERIWDVARDFGVES